MNREKFREIHDLLMEQLDVSRELSDEEILEVIDELILNQSKELFFSLKEKVGLRQELFCSVRKLDVLQELIEDESITEIMVNGPDNIFVERAGKLTRWNKTFTSKEKLEDVIQQIVGRCNRVVNESMPIVDARLENGARVNVVVYPVALNGPILTIRRFPDDPITMEKLISLGTADINYETRKMYMDSLEKEDISEKYKAELLSLFDRLKIENMPDVYSQGKPFSVEQEFFKQDKLFLLYVPNKKKAQSFRQVVDKNDLLWDLTRIHSSQLVRQTKILLCEILNMDKVQRHRRYFLEPLKALIRFCDKYGIDDIEEMEQADENRFYLYLNKESEIIKKQASKIVEFARRTLFLTDSETNWRACIWYMDRFQFDKSRINASSPVKSLSFINIYEKENRWYLQLYAKYLVGISDLSLSNIRNTISFISQFLKYLDGQSKKVTELEIQDIEGYVSVLDKSDIKYSTFNRYITHMHTFLQFLKMKNIEVLKFYPERFLKKGFSEHNERSVPEKTIAHLIKELPAFPEHLQLMYLILFCTGIRKSEVCTIKSGAFYSQGNENWMRIYQSKMRREKVIPVPSLLVGLVNDYEKKYGIKNGEYLFKNKKGGAFNGQTFSNQMIRECKVRGIACGDYIFRAHDYRHNLATSMYGNGVSIQGVRDYLGHSSENMTKQYIDFMPERIVSAEDKYFSKNQSFKLKGAEDDER